MKHDWKRDAKGVVEEFGDDWPYAECRICGDVSAYYRPEVPELNGEECEGLDLGVTVCIAITHPAKASEFDDWTQVRGEVRIPLAQLLAADPDPVGEALADFVERIAGQWRGIRTAHENDWRAALSGSDTQRQRRAAERTESRRCGDVPLGVRECRSFRRGRPNAPSSVPESGRPVSTADFGAPADRGYPGDAGTTRSRLGQARATGLQEALTGDGGPVFGAGVVAGVALGFLGAVVLFAWAVS